MGGAPGVGGAPGMSGAPGLPSALGIGGAAAAPGMGNAAAAPGLGRGQGPQSQVMQLQTGVGSQSTNFAMEGACAQVAAKHLSAGEVQSMAQSMGLDPAQTAELTNCANGVIAPNAPSSPSAGTSTGIVAGGNALAPSSGGGSPIEESFREMTNPTGESATPDLGSLSQFGYELFSQGAAATPASGRLVRTMFSVQTTR
jgi:hypothetical protein